MNKYWFNSKFEKKIDNHIRRILNNINYPVFKERSSLSLINRDYSYLNTAGIGPTLKPSFQETVKYNEYLSGIGLLSGEGNAHYNIAPGIFKEYISNILNCSSEEIIFFENSSQAINIILNSINYNFKDIILTSDQEHPSGYLPLKKLSNDHDLIVYFIPYKKPMSFIKNFENIYKLSRDKTKLVFLSLSSYCTGNLLPIKDILSKIDREKTFIYIDAAQAAGLTKIDIEALDVDFLSFPGHKWYYGPLGTGVLYINNKTKEKLKPSWIGYNSVTESDIDTDIKLKNDADRFLCGTYDISKFLGLTISMMIIDKYHSEIKAFNEECFEIIYSKMESNEDLNINTRQKESTKGVLSISSRKILPHIMEQDAYEKYNIIAKAINYPEKCPSLRISPNFLHGIEPQEKLFSFLKRL